MIMMILNAPFELLHCSFLDNVIQTSNNYYQSLKLLLPSKRYVIRDMYLQKRMFFNVFVIPQGYESTRKHIYLQTCLISRSRLKIVKVSYFIFCCAQRTAIKGRVIMFQNPNSHISRTAVHQWSHNKDKLQINLQYVIKTTTRDIPIIILVSIYAIFKLLKLKIDR